MMRQFILSVLIAASVFALGYLLIIHGCTSAAADAPTSSTIATTGTLPTSGPIVLIDFQHVLNAIVVPRQDLKGAREYHIRTLENPASVEEQQMALMRLQRTKAKIDVYDSILAELMGCKVIVFDIPGWLELVENPLNDGAWGAN